MNCLAPSAATRMLDGLLPENMLGLLSADDVSPAVLALASEQAPNRTIICAGAGSFEQANITLTAGVFIGAAEDAAETILSRLDEIADRAGEIVPQGGWAQTTAELAKAGVDITAKST